MSSRILLVMSGLAVVMAGCALEEHTSPPRKHVPLPQTGREGDIAVVYRHARYTGLCTSAFTGVVLKRWSLIEGECDMVRVTHSSSLLSMSDTLLISHDDAFLLNPSRRKCQEGDWVQIRLVCTLDPLPGSTGVWRKIKHLTDGYTLIVVDEE